MMRKKLCRGLLGLDFSECVNGVNWGPVRRVSRSSTCTCVRSPKANWHMARRCFAGDSGRGLCQAWPVGMTCSASRPNCVMAASNRLRWAKWGRVKTNHQKMPTPRMLADRHHQSQSLRTKKMRVQGRLQVCPHRGSVGRPKLAKGRAIDKQDRFTAAARLQAKNGCRDPTPN